jgi:hypothetical protein
MSCSYASIHIILSVCPVRSICTFINSLSYSFGPLSSGPLMFAQHPAASRSTSQNRTPDGGHVKLSTIIPGSMRVLYNSAVLQDLDFKFTNNYWSSPSRPYRCGKTTQVIPKSSFISSVAITQAKSPSQPLGITTLPHPQHQTIYLTNPTLPDAKPNYSPA